MKKVIFAIALAMLAASAGAQTYYKKEYYAPAVLWPGAQGTYWYTIEEALYTRDVELRTYAGGNYIGEWGRSCRDWDSRGCGERAYNRKYLGVLYSLHSANGIKYGEGVLMERTSCPTGAAYVNFEDHTLSRMWTACEMTVAVSQNPGPQPMPTNPFVTGIDWIETGGCKTMDINFASKIYTFCFNRMQVY